LRAGIIIVSVGVVVARVFEVVFVELEFRWERENLLDLADVAFEDFETAACV
jgi:hypothetical protein